MDLDASWWALSVRQMDEAQIDALFVPAVKAPSSVDQTRLIKMAGKRGMLVVFEGLDRSGKSTQCERLAETLRKEGESVEHMRFPNRITPIGQMINNYLTGQTNQDDHVIHLLFSANRWEAAKTIEDHINAGTTVVIDRYSYSGAVYSAAKQVPSMSLEWCRQPEVGLPRPDLCLFLDLSSEEAAKRGGFGTERYEKQDLQNRVRQLYGEMRKHDDEREDITVVDAGRPIDVVESDILEIVKKAKSKLKAEGSELRRMRPW
ncbi:Thymidylate kinase [Saxophila tyrrhenica]|uniref:Thymidylate kinase n=1 Tax=Saxophila tyrrhenica TaxID=1690608 RepID=A0AAV9P0W9_9PEZI|nr:Thymidylate kinase [Saxophila tyrrhenica]